MSIIVKVLEKFEDWELAYFHKYKLNSYVAETQEKISTYILNVRGLKINSIDTLIENHSSKEINDQKERCPRCKTDKLRTDKVNWAIPLFHAGAEDELAMLYEIKTGKTYFKDKITCDVCGFLIEDPNNRTLKEKVFGVLFDSWIWTGLKNIIKGE